MNQSLKSIAIVSPAIDPAFGGQNGLTYDLVRHLKQKYQVTLIAGHISSDLKKDPALTWQRVLTFGPGIIQFVMFPVLASLSLLFKKYDLIVCTGANSFIFDVNIIHFAHHGLLKTTQDLHFKLGWYQTLALRLNVVMEKLIYRKNKHYFCVSEKISSEMKTLLKTPNVTTLWNTITAIHALPDHKIEIQSALKNEPVKILFAGDLKRNIKNFDTVIAALKNLDPSQYELWICSSIAKEKIKNKLKGISHQFLGYVKEMDTIYEKSHILIHPCIYEPFGLVILEAYLSGSQIICAGAAYTGITPLIEKESGVWILKNPLDSQELTQTLQKAIHTPPAPRTLGNWKTPQALQQEYEKALIQVFSENSLRKT